MSPIVYVEDFRSSRSLSASSSDFSCFESSTSRFFFSAVRNFPVTLKKLVDSKSWISLSLSTINFTATDWTLPAESQVLIFFQSTGESSKPTSLSKTLLACCASTKCMSMVLGFSIALVIAVFVISWKTILGVVAMSSPSWLARCRPIASPSRSSSVAIRVFSADFESDFSSEITLFLSGETTYSGRNQFSILIPIHFVGRSTVCPYDALTS